MYDDGHKKAVAGAPLVCISAGRSAVKKNICSFLIIGLSVSKYSIFTKIYSKYFVMFFYFVKALYKIDLFLISFQNVYIVMSILTQPSFTKVFKIKIFHMNVYYAIIHTQKV